MAHDDERDEFPPHELDRLYALYNGRDPEGGPAGIGVQARDKLIGRLIEQLRCERELLRDEHNALERSVTARFTRPFTITVRSWRRRSECG
jgi:hypothetical protein